MRFYDWDKTMSYQTGTNGEICLVLGAKDIGKTFNLRRKCIERHIKTGEIFAEFCRTKEEMKHVMPGYFDKLQSAGFFQDYLFKVEKGAGYIAKRPKDEKEKPCYRLICYFLALTAFQTEKKRTFMFPKRIIFDEAVIDVKDRVHRYLKDEFLILANLLDSVTRQQPNGENYYVYLLGNSVNLSCPYFQNLGITRMPEFGYSYYKNKTVLLHYVEPWDAEERRVNTLVGRMLEGHEESKVIFDNEFSIKDDASIMRKTPNAKYAFAIKWGKQTFALWADHKQGLWFVSEKLPKNACNVYVLSKNDMTLNYQMIRKSDYLTKLVSELYYVGCLRFETPYIREAFFEVLSFLGVK